MRPAPVADEVLKHANRPELVNELARFNLEANANPRVFGGSCLADMEAELRTLVNAADRSARTQDARILLTGINSQAFHSSFIDPVIRRFCHIQFFRIVKIDSVRLIFVRRTFEFRKEIRFIRRFLAIRQNILYISGVRNIPGGFGKFIFIAEHFGEGAGCLK